MEIPRAGDLIGLHFLCSYASEDRERVIPLNGMADESEQAVIWIEKAYDLGDPELPYLKTLRRFPLAGSKKSC